MKMNELIESVKKDMKEWPDWKLSYCVTKYSNRVKREDLESGKYQNSMPKNEFLQKAGFFQGIPHMNDIEEINKNEKEFFEMKNGKVF